MAYLVFARKYRPLTFEEIVGQRHIVQTLKNSILQNRLHHAFIFSGPRGVGKTTTARILARCINCETGITITPCNKCSSCLEIINGSSMDVQEIDAASHTGVDNVRDILEKVAYSPIRARYKVYIVDEAHMLSKAAFNALLKTLEEPPPHVKFVFATTEPNKILPTITSRCQRFNFRRADNEDVVEHLEGLLKKESITCSRQALSIIAREAGGSIRDALSILEHVVSFSSGEINEETVSNALGLISRTTLIRLFKYILNKEKEKAIDIIDESYMAGFDLQILFNDILTLTRNALLMKIGQNKILYNDLSQSESEEIKPLINQITTQGLHMLFDTLFRTVDEIAKSEQPLFTAEVSILKAISISSLKPLDDVIARLDNLEKTILSGQGTVVDRSSIATSTLKKEISLDQPDIWLKIIDSVKKKGKIHLATILEDGIFISSDNERIKIGFKGAIQLESMRDHNNINVVKQVIKEITGREMEIVVSDISISERSAPSVSEEISKKKSEIDTRLSEEMMQNPIVQTAIKIFNAKVVNIKGEDEN